MSVQRAFSTIVRSAKLVAVAAFAAAHFAATAFAAPTDLDGAWGNDGAFAPATGVVNAIMQPDGALVLFTRTGDVIRLAAIGQPDLTFGGGGRILPPVPGLIPQVATARPDGSIDIIWISPPVHIISGVNQCDVAQWKRYLPDGLIDPVFSADTPAVHCGLSDLVAARDRRSYLLYRVGSIYDLLAGVYRYDYAGKQVADPIGSVDDSLFTAPVWVPSGLALDAQDRLIVSLAKRNAHEFGVSRYVNDSLDVHFGTEGIASATLPGEAQATGVLPLADGSLLVYGFVFLGRGYKPAIARFTSDGYVDATFGTSGVTVVGIGREFEDIDAPNLAIDASGRIVVAATTRSLDVFFTRVARLRSDGTPDAHFGGAGVAPGTYPALLQSIFARPSGEIVLVTMQQASQLRGGDLPVVHALRERRAAEFFNADYGHYFVTADEAEQYRLDGAEGHHWMRTGEEFNVFDEQSSPFVPMCRFWSNQSFAPKSSHFYTPYPDECAKVKLNSAWQFERDAFFARLPEGETNSRTCPTGTQPLFRVYNNGSSGSPNHRYTTEPAVLATMIEMGWTMEGEANTSVFACLPLQD